MGSVKDLKIIKPTTGSDMGIGEFHFTDRYSVFDWGEMPDHLKNKGASLCTMSAYFFEQARKNGILSHYLGVESNDSGEIAYTDSLTQPATKMHVRLARVIKPTPVYDGEELTGYNYDAVRSQSGNFVIPIEVIYRNSLPKGSSVFKRLKEGTLTLEEMGLAEMPAEGDRLPGMFFDGSTKYEEFDRYPGWTELQSISGLSHSEISEMKRYVLAINDIVSEGMIRAGLINEDGKFEFVFTPKRLMMLGDTLGTLDECRFTYNGTDISKEIPRQWYRYSQPVWIEQINAAKKANRKEWKELVTAWPEPLPQDLKEILENLYASVTNAVVDKQLFAGVPQVDELAKEYEKFKTASMK